MSKTDYLQKIYEINPETGNYIIEVALSRYSDIFNDWDHSSFTKRDFDPDLESFLESCSDDIPFKYEIDLVFYIPQEIRDEEIEKLITIKFRNYYSFYLRAETRYIQESDRRTLIYMLSSFLFLLLALSFEGNISRNNLFFNTLLEGLNIGGWVFLWEAISYFFFKRGDISDKLKDYKRFLRCQIYFKNFTKRGKSQSF